MDRRAFLTTAILGMVSKDLCTYSSAESPGTVRAGDVFQVAVTRKDNGWILFMLSRTVYLEKEETGSDMESVESLVPLEDLRVQVVLENPDHGRFVASTVSRGDNFVMFFGFRMKVPRAARDDVTRAGGGGVCMPRHHRIGPPRSSVCPSNADICKNRAQQNNDPSAEQRKGG